MRARELAVARIAACADACARRRERSVERREGGGAETDPDAAPVRRLVRVTEQAEAGDVGDRVRRERPQDLGGAVVERRHPTSRFRQVAFRCEYEPGAERLREEDGITRLSAALDPDAVRMDGADDRQAVLRLGVPNRVAAGEDRARRSHSFVRSRKHRRDEVGRELLGKSGDRER